MKSVAYKIWHEPRNRLWENRRNTKILDGITNKIATIVNYRCAAWVGNTLMKLYYQYDRDYL